MPISEPIRYPGKKIGEGFLTDAGDVAPEVHESFDRGMTEIEQAEHEAANDRNVLGTGELRKVEISDINSGVIDALREHTFFQSLLHIEAEDKTLRRVAHLILDIALDEMGITRPEPKRPGKAKGISSFVRTLLTPTPSHEDNGY